MHANFQLRVRQTGGSGVDFDYWHIDDIVITDYDVFSNPIIPNGSYDPSVRSIEFRPAGTINATTGSNTPYFDIDFRIRVISP